MTLAPQSEAALAEVVAGADAPLALRGGGTRGGVVAGQGLSTAGLGGIRLYEPGALVMVAGAGTPLAEAEAAAAAEGQRLAFEPPDLRAILGRTGASTLGGVFAANASGPRRVQAGAARDALLGIRLVTGRGEVVANGGRVMKNVTGYDLVKLSAGSRGGLGVLTEVAFRLQARPEAEVTLQAQVPDRAAGLALMAQALATPFEPTGAALSGGRVSLRLEGLAGSVRYRQAALAAALRVDLAVVEGEASRALWQGLRDLAPLAALPGALWRLVLRPARAAEVIAAVEVLAGTAVEALADWGGGQVWLRVPGARDIRPALGPHGHARLVLALPGMDHIPAAPPENPAVARLTAGLRAAFDPKGLFTAGALA